MTISIVAFDKKHKQMGIGGFSKWFALGSMLPFIETGKGVVASQGTLNVDYGLKGLELMGSGKSPKEAFELISKTDKELLTRQICLMGSNGELYSFTGDRCLPSSGHIQGEGYSIQGNILKNGSVLKAAAKSFEESKGKLSSRIVQALLKAEETGGDLRGRQSAFVKIVSIDSFNKDAYFNTVCDVRVDDHSDPLSQLHHLVEKQSDYRKFDLAAHEFEEGDQDKSLELFNQLFDSGKGCDDFRFWYGFMFKDLELDFKYDPQKFFEDVIKKDQWQELFDRMQSAHGK